MRWMFLLSLLGLLDTSYLISKTWRHQVPVCLLGQSCAFVLQSAYNHVLGVRNEVLGFLFYLGVIVASAASLAGFLTIPGWLWLLGLGGALAMSIILTGIQVFVLRAYCSWCLASALINALLCIAAVAVFHG